MKPKLSIDNYLDSHFIHRSNWLRAAVLGANDGIISISSLASAWQLPTPLENRFCWLRFLGLVILCDL